MGGEIHGAEIQAAEERLCVFGFGSLRSQARSCGWRRFACLRCTGRETPRGGVRNDLTRGTRGARGRMTEGDAGAWVHALAVLSSEMEDSDDIDDVREDARR